MVTFILSHLLQLHLKKVIIIGETIKVDFEESVQVSSQMQMFSLLSHVCGFMKYIKMYNIAKKAFKVHILLTLGLNVP